jgi:S1-C subfamily serine protease
VNLFDWIAVALVVLMAIAGYFRGLITAALSLAGVVGGAIIGSRLAPHVLSGGSSSPYTPLVALAGAAVGAILLESIGGYLGAAMRSSVRLKPLRTLDSAGGLVLGGATGLALVWVLGSVALLLPGQTQFRRDAQGSVIVRRLNELVPPRSLLRALARIDPILAIEGPLAFVAPPSPDVLDQPGVKRAAPSVVRVVGTACGIGIAGSGWVARRGVVVTAAHVVAGQRSPLVEASGEVPLPAEPIGFDSANDVAVLRVRGLRPRPLRLVDPRSGASVAILGYPGTGTLEAAPARIGATDRISTENAYGGGPVSRLVTSLRGRVRHGNSGGPAVDARGNVRSTVFAARIGSNGGFGIPAEVVRRDLARAHHRVSTGDCAP